jgi:hypothetical protein
VRNVTLPANKKFRAKVRRIFDEVQAARPPGLWRDDEVIPLAMYARCIALIDREVARFQDCDPAFDPKALAMFHQQMMALGRKLGLTAAAGELATLGRLARDHQRTAEFLAHLDREDPDELLARPEVPRH